jgi:hypothetical protein
MFPYVRNIGKLRLTGAIKTSVKDKWTYIHSTEYRERKLDYRSHNYDVDEELAGILTLPPSSFPPTCSCPRSCLPSSNQYSLFDFDHNDMHEHGSCICRGGHRSDSIISHFHICPVCAGKESEDWSLDVLAESMKLGVAGTSENNDVSAIEDVGITISENGDDSIVPTTLVVDI